MCRSSLLRVLVLLAMLAGPGAAQVRFQDVTEEAGLQRYLVRWRVAHGAAWGDADGDERPDLYLGAFADRPLYREPKPPIPNPLFLNTAEGFVLSRNEVVRLTGRHARTTMALFADLDNDGDLDLIAGNHVARKHHVPSIVFENRGRGDFALSTAATQSLPARLAVRNVAALDADHDGRLDLFMTDGSYGRRSENRPRLLLNAGGLRFKDASEEYGLPVRKAPGLGLALGDLNDDGRLDVFVAHGNQLLLSRSGKGWRSHHLAHLPPARGENWPCGASFGDLDGDGRLDFVLTIHGKPGSIHVYRNAGLIDGVPRFDPLLERELPRTSYRYGSVVKGTHAVIDDFDNDGRCDIFLAAAYETAEGTLQPVVFRNLGAGKGSAVRFDLPPLDRCVGHYAPGPVADYDRDGRLDVFLPAWHEQPRNFLLRNVSPGGNWLVVCVRGDGKRFNTMGVGAIVRIYKDDVLRGRRDISIGNGYSSGEEALAHFGLGEIESCDVEVRWRDRRLVRRGVKAGQYLTITMTE